MKRILATVLFCVTALSFSACSWIQSDGDGNTTVPYNLTTADETHLNTIGADFRNYFEADTTLSDEVETQYNATLTYWAQNGSDWSVYETIAGLEMNGPYIVYVEADEDLTEADRESRYLNVAAWGLNIETRVGPVGGETPSEEVTE